MLFPERFSLFSNTFQLFFLLAAQSFTCFLFDMS